ncbi:hypothetical protein [Motilimonas sp. KMU-193]|uniref:hypothetical protein n=1 Tax=Motilimonas sp. KMU-193 TaxID=3388668 RepID=UPI00396B157C
MTFAQFNTQDELNPPSTLASFGQLEYTVNGDALSIKWQFSIKEHRYLLSHLINAKIAIPSVFMLELALGTLAKTSGHQAKTLLAQSIQWHRITAPRLAYLTGGDLQTLYFDWQPSAKDEHQPSYCLTVKYDKLNQLGQCVRPKLTVLTAVLATVSQPRPDIRPHLAEPSGELLERQLIDNFKAQSPATLGILFNNLTYKYLYNPKSKALWCYSDLHNSHQYCLQHETQPDFCSPVLAAMSAVQHLPFYAYLHQGIALPSDIGTLTYLADRYNPLNNQGKLVCLITPTAVEHRVDVWVFHEADLSPILHFAHYHLQPQLN